VTHARIEVFTEAHQVEEIVEAITDGAYTGVPGDGIVAVTPVERLIHIRSCAEKGKGP
jgi:nitrogen regulatory protein P-II 1